MIRSKAIVERILAEVRTAVVQHSIAPGLAVVLVGEDPASRVYVRNKSAQAEACGFNSRQFELPVSTSEVELLDLINSVSRHARAITPVPGGAGPMTIAMLMRDTLEVALNQNEQ
ncbi:bifunctional methylenetetrahydrofolate dehydrogenase/methenyltetrahydrofolate cyclohydrolase [Pseudomonas tolaasii]|uniref:Bifunctional methylenetetrahydrofolate dehydrogenase/methenyltetrahydrofolate cyclohydrolase n=1 Tax=Pseudomonas tolaasii TaxID=29442 RepID=A0A7Y8DSN0_PSETO|nr:tetrahydrofolate dehydrogenase/cyclohydrolase catalytic domain-containing protein [Pseudomonas tolaasii]ARB31319.1 hypothetical protein B5P22_29770 [Pseudomonas tolaasii]KAB0466575.1 bifunctional methylenetetrahydrofolate dehydrogenase/methenyltetrahydrofolate cyclohydrolase [Pseudomonas tolaasii]MBY8943436.1 bifunctional methylenetetrahydrofolate dehydrogenase/methenyltetrahydrofolate cyclohydrolase [Pseudomonas tolaasii]NVZ45470.1 bifunctional methylenetetrahydrofolate dehydrogenase/methen